MHMPTPPNEPGTDPSCRKVNEILGRMGDKWTVMAITMLAERPRRFNELKRLIGGISQQMLTRTLKALERDGMVRRKVYPTIPPQVEYSLTDLGRSLSDPLLQLSMWVLNHLQEIEANRALHDGEAS
ncbi:MULTISPECIES: helix-turn-helix domain-containing protein [unclassified Rhizobium]|uniref:winged helix-turn-helix transcriptional regulator n=1 Tax=unclassified Rhizobium TaxID=2613769 RepID=UPI000271B10C|nr:MULTISPECIES: helix-turn-helix domain-containing protein [unclassified Rhizobium]EJL58430.1 putative transcriptional regulator [Rhizobium sp. CF122]MBB3395478.1 DNA-binding HxlR family transcriptional regulator [Rhizobium sp. BK060]MBB4168841.1 DNA-binding HxlR family transcriptional regulator [Rhizobium sp. BK538]TCM75145.1 HxlR family transcriptional regulator [Rhizobium sp. BK068]